MGKTTGEIEPGDPLDRTEEEWSAAGPSDVNTVDQADQQATELRLNIEHTRAEMSETIGALQEKLDPARIAEQVKEQIRVKANEAYDTAKESLREATIGRAEKLMENVSDKVSDVTQRAGMAVSDTGSWIVEMVRENPIAFALIGAGLGALALNNRQKQSWSSRPSYGDARRPYGNYSGYGSQEYGRPGYPQREYDSGYREPAGGSWGSTERPSGNWAQETGAEISGKAREIADSVAETARAAKDRVTGAVSSAASSVRDTASTLADTTREQMSHLSEEARYRARGASDMFSNTLQENPLALGVAALAAGALIGLVLPATRVESEYMGEARDQFVDKAKEVARETADKVQRVTEEAGRTLKAEAERNTGSSITSDPIFPVKV